MDICLVIIVILCILLLILLVRQFFIKKSINEIINTMNEIIKTDTNNLITISYPNKNLRKLTNELNKVLKEIRKEELVYKNGNSDLKKSITNITHDLRTPLTVISGYVELLLKEELSTRQQKYLETVNDKAHNLIYLTEQLFDYSKSLDLDKKMKAENVNINELLEEVLVSFYIQFDEKGIKPKIDIAKDKITKNVDKEMLNRIFENIISNAIKYSDKEFNVCLDNTGRIYFSNTARNLDPVSVEKIFDRYYTINNAKKNSGVGLSIAKQLAELNGISLKANYKKEKLIIELKFIK